MKLSTALAATIAALASPLCAQGDNVLILIADDLGVDKVGCYQEGTSPPPTPNIDALAARGVLFRNAWATPLCSPTRACIHAGRYPVRTHIGNAIPGGGTGVLELDEVTLPEVLDRGGSGYAHALIGKWHLGDSTNGGDLGPNLAGWSHFTGMIQGAVADYYSWPRTVNGVTSTATTYTTTQIVDDALAWIAQQGKPWVCMVAFNAPHTPYQAPPSHLHTQDLTGKTPATDPVAFHTAMVEALDTEIGRLLGSLGAQLATTNVVLLGDNGTAFQVTQPPFAPLHAKGSPYEGGVNVPLLVAGPAVLGTPREEDALVAAVDLFATVSELCGVDARAVVPSYVALDSVSFKTYLDAANQPDVRGYVFAEQFDGDDFAGAISSGAATARAARFKLIRFYSSSGSPQEELYDLLRDPFEQSDLLRGVLTLAQRQAYVALGQVIDLYRSPRGTFVTLGSTSCQGSNGAPAISGSGTPAVGSGYGVTLTNGAPGRPAVLMIGASATSWGSIPLPYDVTAIGAGSGCWLLCSMDVTLAAATSSSGQAALSIAVPQDLTLVLETVFQQWAVVDPSAPGNSLGVVVSDALAATLGV